MQPRRSLQARAATSRDTASLSIPHTRVSAAHRDRPVRHHGNQQTSTAIAGVLTLVGMLAGALSIVPVLEEPDYLALISAHEREILLGAGAQLLMIPAYVGFALCLYPTLKRGDEALSLGFVGLRLIAAMFHLVGVILLPLFLVLSESFIQSAGANPSHIGILGELLRSGRDLVNHVALIIALVIGDLLLFRILHLWKLVPRWLSSWGFLGAGLALASSLMVLFGMADVVTPLYLTLNAPLAIQTLIFALWLIARGFNMTLLELAGAQQRVS